MAPERGSKDEARPRTLLGRVFYDTLSGYLGALTPSSRRFWLLVPLSGALAGIGAVGAVYLMLWVQRLTWGGSGDLLQVAAVSAPWRRVLLPIGAGLLVVIVGWLSGTEPRGHGTTQVIASIWVQRGRVPMRVAILRGIVSLVAVAMGASLGREGALVYVGAAAGSWLGRRFQVAPDQRKLLVACGASAGMAAAYNTPIGGALFGLEVFLGGLALELYGPIIFASVTATMISRALLFDHPSYVIPKPRLSHPAELLLYLALGLLIGVAAGIFVRVVEGTSRLSLRLPPRLRQLLPIAGLALVGVAGLFFPQLYGNGYGTVNEALVGKVPLQLLVALPPLKLLLSAICAASGVPGGLLTPSLFVGALLGGAFGTVAHAWVPGLVLSTGGYALVAMGAILAGSTHATLAAAIMLFELTGDYDMILPLLAACVVATTVSRAIAPESIYTAPLRRAGIQLPRVTRPVWMQQEGIQRLLRTASPRVTPQSRLDEILLTMIRVSEDEELWVVDDRGLLVGAISLESIRKALFGSEELGELRATDLMHRTQPISLDASLWDVTRRALASSVSRLPVISPREGGRFKGTIATADVLAAAKERPGPRAPIPGRAGPQSSSSSLRPEDELLSSE